MGKVKQPWQDERDRRWDAWFDEHYAIHSNRDAARDYAISKMEEYDEDRGFNKGP